MSSLIEVYLKKSPQERIDTLRQFTPAIETVNNRIREKLTKGVGNAEAEKIVQVLSLEPVLLKEALQALQAEDSKKGLPWLRKISGELHSNSQSLKPNYPELAEALLRYDDALYRQILQHISGAKFSEATSESNKEVRGVATAANKIAGRRSYFQAPLALPVVGANSSSSTSVAGQSNSNGTAWVAANPAIANSNSAVAVPVAPPHKKMDWKRLLLWLLMLAVALALGYTLWKGYQAKQQEKWLGGPTAIEPSAIPRISPEVNRILADDDDIALQYGYSAKSPAFDFRGI